MSRKPGNPVSAQHAAQAHATGRTMADVLTLPDPLRRLATWMLRQKVVSLEEVVAHLGQETDQVRSLLETLVGQGFAQVHNQDSVPRYRMRLLSRQRRQPTRDLWQTLSKKLE